MRFSSPTAAGLEGLARVPGVAEIGYDGATVDVTVDPLAVVRIASELARRELAPSDFTPPTRQPSMRSLR